MSQEIIIPFDENIVRLPSCLTVHKQLRFGLNQFTTEEYASLMQKLCETKQSRICGIVRKDGLETIVLALAFYRAHPTTYEGIRFEVYDLTVDEKERNHGLGTRLLQDLIRQAKECGAPSLVLQCDLTNTDAHRFFFRHGLGISSFTFYLDKIVQGKTQDQIKIVDISDLAKNEDILSRTEDVLQQFGPGLSSDETAYADQIRNICQTGPAHMLVAISNDEKKDVLGVAIYRLSHHLKYSQFIYCDDLITDENKRSLGVGRALMNAMKHEAERLGLNRIALDSDCQQGRAHKFYHREGFRIDQFEMTIIFK
ncbi:unnamed protein product [Adineta ricciae]|uniref:N-acetyltransferase domain-containing protein n=1 Tax=Adineta ricciae TaxID=249248 RepID=A0A814WE71_ADIRI|nr:unnamed protein product [Adineta ricciae]CAF1411979.1 unnamed protein product [Adineta ricciae]